MSADIQSVRCSTYENAFDTKPVNGSLSSILDAIRSESLKAQITRLRALRSRDEKAYKKDKWSLPAVTFSGVFTQRDAEHFQQASGFMVCDIDDVQDASGVKELVGADEHVKAAFISPSGVGVKFLVAIPALSDTALFARVFTHVSAYFADIYGLELDASGKDAPRLCFLSYDPDIIVNDDVTPFEIDLTVDALPIERDDEPNTATTNEPNTATNHENDDPAFRRAVLQVLTESDGVVNAYDDFFRVLAACKREYIAYETFDAICRRSNGYDETGNLKAWVKFDTSKHAGKVVSFGTLYAYATKTDEQRQRLNALLPANTPTNTPYHVDDDAILTAAAMPTDAPNLQTIQEQAMTNDEWMSDMPLALADVFDSLRNEVNAPCNYGKSSAIQTWLDAMPETWIPILTPTTPLRSQLCQAFPAFCEVKEGDEFPTNRRFLVTTREKFNASYPLDRLNSGETFVVQDEVHLNTTDISYKGRMLAELQAKLEYCRTLELTGTPVRFPHHTHPSTRFKRENAEPIHATWLYYTDTLPTIRDIVKLDAERGLVPVFFLNSKQAIQEAGEMLLSYLSIKTADKRPYLVYRDDVTQDITPDAAILQDAAAIPDDCLCILTTSLFEVGINVHSRAGTVVLFPRHKDHATRRQAVSVHLPCEVVQSVSRFRKGWEELMIAIPSFQKCARSTFDYETEYQEHLQAALALKTAYNLQERAGKYFRHVANIRADMAEEHRKYIRRDASGKFIVYEQGIDFLLLESMRHAMTNDPVFYAKELAKEFTPVIVSQIKRMTSLLTQEEKAGISDIRDDIEHRRFLEWNAELDRLAKPETVLQDDGKMSRAERWVKTFTKYIGKDNAVLLVRHVGDDAHRLNTLQRQARREKYLANRDKVTISTFDRIDAIVRSRKEWDSSAFMKKVTPTLAKDIYLCHMLTGKSAITRWTPNRAARILEGFAGVQPVIKKANGKTIRVYAVVTLTPFRDIVFETSGKRLEECFEWTKYSQVEMPETPVNVGKAGEKSGYTFLKNCIYTTEKSVTDADLNERAAIMEFVGNMGRQDAERAAAAQFAPVDLRDSLASAMQNSVDDDAWWLAR